MGVCRLGFLVDLISEPVITGFTSGVVPAPALLLCALLRDQWRASGWEISF